MYSSNSQTKQRLDLDQVKEWVSGVDWGQVHACGFYGGGTLYFQSCDGEYPRLQGFDEPFSQIMPNILKLISAKENR